MLVAIDLSVNFMSFTYFYRFSPKGETEDEAVIFALQHTQKHLEELRYTSHKPIICTLPKCVIFRYAYSKWFHFLNYISHRILKCSP